MTFIRDVGSNDNVAVELMRAVESGRIKKAPDIQAAGKPICMTGGTTWGFLGYEADGENECRKAARLMLRSGANLIKLMATGGVVTHGSKPGAVQLSENELRAAIEEAHHLGYKACCHAESVEGAKNAIRAGIDCIEHGDELDDEAIQMMLERGVALDATVSTIYCIIDNADKTDAEFVEKSRECAEKCVDSFRKAYRAGVLCVLGSDCGTPCCFYDNSAYELIVMVEKGGLTPFEALSVGTINSAKVCGVEDMLGSVSVGKKAHFAVFEHNPVEDIRALSNCIMTIKSGEIIYQK